MRVCRFREQVHINPVTHMPGLCVQKHMLVIGDRNRESYDWKTFVCFLEENLYVEMIMHPFHVVTVNEPEP